MLTKDSEWVKIGSIRSGETKVSDYKEGVAVQDSTGKYLKTTRTTRHKKKRKK